MTSSSKFWRYHYKGDPKTGCYWSTLFLDSRGAFAYVGDTGSGAYGHFCCDDIRHFVAYDLANASKYPNYLAQKLCRGQKTDFNGERTKKRVKRDILESRRQNPDISKEMARDAWMWLPSEGDSSREWEDYLQEYPEIFGDEWYYLLSYDHDSWVLSFIKNSLPGLQALIRKELEEEACKKSLLML